MVPCLWSHLRFILLLVARYGEPTGMEGLNSGPALFFGLGDSMIWFVVLRDRESQLRFASPRSSCSVN